MKLISYFNELNNKFLQHGVDEKKTVLTSGKENSTVSEKTNYILFLQFVAI